MQFGGWNDIHEIENYDEKKINIVIPMAWAWSRFVKAGFELPKPLIDVKGKTMVEWAVSSFDFLKESFEIRYIFVALNDHLEEDGLEKFLKEKYLNW